SLFPSLTLFPLAFSLSIPRSRPPSTLSFTPSLSSTHHSLFHSLALFHPALSLSL
ncbi:hypothetical protein NDU88_006296, partial [Pleurodeles waltl]